MGIRKTWLLRLLGFALVFLARITTRAQVPPDVVHLQDGTFLRGTIVERSPTQLVLMLPTGEVRTYPTEVLATVEVGEQPSDVAEEEEPVDEEESHTVHIRVVSEQSGVTLHEVIGAVGNHDTWRPVCDAPCEADILPGTRRFGVSLGTGRTHRISRGIELTQDGHTLALAYEDQRSTRSTGFTVLGVGLGLGTASFLIGLVGVGIGMPESTEIAFFAIGGVTTFLSLLIGLGFALQGDTVAIDVDPDGAIRF